MINRDSAVIFLDIDGVLAPYGRLHHAVLDAACVLRVHQLAQHARIVLASTWPVEEARTHFPVDDELDEETERRAPPLARLRGVARWLAEHREITRWASIDDDDQARELELLRRRDPSDPLLRALDPARFVRTDWVHVWPWREMSGAGLTEARMHHALTLVSPKPSLTWSTSVSIVQT